MGTAQVLCDLAFLPSRMLSCVFAGERSRGAGSGHARWVSIRGAVGRHGWGWGGCLAMCRLTCNPGQTVLGLWMGKVWCAQVGLFWAPEEP